MRNRQRELQTARWRIPAEYAAASLIAAVALPRLEAHLLPQLKSAIAVPAAMAIYSSIASGMIALTGIVFSLTFVMVQFSATAYSPRLVLWLARDPLMSHALGVFVATFLYAIAAIAWLDRTGAGVPLISALVVVGLLLASVFFFVALIQRVAMLQVNSLLSFTADQARCVIDQLYPPLDQPPAADVIDLCDRPVSQLCLYSGRPQAVQRIDIERLVAFALEHDVFIEVRPAIGDTLLESMPIFVVRGGAAALDERPLLASLELGEERTFDQDPKYGLRLLVDVAIKALSAAINDPTTAVQALDQIGDLLYRLGRRRLEIGSFFDVNGAPRVFLPFPSWEDYLRLAFDEIRTCGATSVQVMRRMNALIADLVLVVPPERRPALEQWHRALASSIDRHFEDVGEKQEALIEDRQGLGVPSRRPARSGDVTKGLSKVTALPVKHA